MADELERRISLRAARQNKGLTMPQAAEKLGITYYSLQGYERYRTSVPLVVAWKMSKLYGVPLQCLDPGPTLLL